MNMKERKILAQNGVHIGSYKKVKFMEKFIFRVRPDGLAIINLEETMRRAELAAKFLAGYEPSKVLVVAAREQAMYPAEVFATKLDFDVVVGRFYPGILTNPGFELYREPDVVFVADPIADKQAIFEAYKIGLPVVALASTNNEPRNVDLIVPCNNKGRRSLAAIFWLLTNYVLRAMGKLPEDKYIEEKVEDFMAIRREEK